MKKKMFSTVLFILLAVFTLTAESVFEEELLSSSGEDIIFKNYTGPHKVINTAEQIKGIGRIMGAGTGRISREADYFNKYLIIHAVDYSVVEGLDADILVLADTAGVDHIDNLRRIISGYLESAYAYEAERAESLSVFITVYNAVHRGNIDYFRERYKKIVYQHLDDEKAGLALSYKQWPGNTMLVIPLTPKAGTDTVGDLDTEVLTEEEVVLQVREEDGRRIKERREMVELKEDEVQEERKEILEERQVLEERKQELLDKKEELLQEEDPLSQQLLKVDEELEEINDAEAELDEREDLTGEREEKIIAERETIAEDQEEILETVKVGTPQKKASETSVEASDGVSEEKDMITFLKLSGSSGKYTGQLLLINPATGKIAKQSEIDSIRVRGYNYADKEIISVAGETVGNRIISIVRMNPSSLEVTDAGNAEVFIDSAIVNSDGKYYASVKVDESWRVGMFDDDLKLIKVSEERIFPATEMYLSGNIMTVQNSDGNIIRINTDSFHSVK